jgi:hypothetical protein
VADAGAAALTAGTKFGGGYAYQLRHFFPGVFNEKDRYFNVLSTANFQMNFASGINLTSSSIYYQVAASGVNGPVVAGTSNPTTDTVQISFFMKRVTNQVEQARMSVSPFLSCFLQQQQPLATGSSTFNQSFAENQISAYQQLCIINSAVSNSVSFDEYDDSAINAGAAAGSTNM